MPVFLRLVAISSLRFSSRRDLFLSSSLGVVHHPYSCSCFVCSRSSFTVHSPLSCLAVVTFSSKASPLIVQHHLEPSPSPPFVYNIAPFASVPLFLFLSLCHFLSFSVFFCLMLFPSFTLIPELKYTDSDVTPLGAAKQPPQYSPSAVAAAFSIAEYEDCCRTSKKPCSADVDQ